MYYTYYSEVEVRDSSWPANYSLVLWDPNETILDWRPIHDWRENALPKKNLEFPKEIPTNERPSICGSLISSFLVQSDKETIALYLFTLGFFQNVGLKELYKALVHIYPESHEEIHSKEAFRPLKLRDTPVVLLLTKQSQFFILPLKCIELYLHFTVPCNQAVKTKIPQAKFFQSIRLWTNFCSKKVWIRWKFQHFKASTNAGCIGKAVFSLRN